MGSDIKEVDYDEIINKASKIAQEANEMQNNIKDAFSKIEAMSNHWFGFSYDQFIEVVNMSTQPLTQIFEISVSDIPHEIAAKAKSYAAGNQTNVGVSFSEQTAIILNELPKTNKGSKLRFQDAEVRADQSAIKAKFEAAKNSAEQAKSTSESLSSAWQSISGDTNIRELKSAFGRVIKIVENLCRSLDNNITQQANSINALETVMDAVQAAPKVVDNAIDAVQDAATNLANQVQESASQLWTNLTGKN